MMMDIVAQNESSPTVFSIPTRLEILQQQGDGFEGRVFSQPPRIAMYDNNGEIIRNLGLGTPWTAGIEPGLHDYSACHPFPIQFRRCILSMSRSMSKSS